MHPRWPHGTAPAPARAFPPSVLPPSVPPPPGLPPPVPPPPAPRRTWQPRQPVGWPLARLIALLAGSAALAAGCGQSGHSAAATKTVSHPVTACGSAKTPANVPVKVEVAKGKVACADALAIERSYTSAVAQGRAPGNGRGPVEVSGWKCQAFTTPVSLKTGDVSACHRSGAEILAILPPP